MIKVSGGARTLRGSSLTWTTSAARVRERWRRTRVYACRRGGSRGPVKDWDLDLEAQRRYPERAIAAGRKPPKLARRSRSSCLSVFTTHDFEKGLPGDFAERRRIASDRRAERVRDLATLWDIWPENGQSSAGFLRDSLVPNCALLCSTIATAVQHTVFDQFVANGIRQLQNRLSTEIHTYPAGSPYKKLRINGLFATRGQSDRPPLKGTVSESETCSNCCSR